MPFRGVAALLLAAWGIAAAGAYTRVSDAVIGSPVSCSAEEKFCFRFNRLYSAADGKCRPLLAQCGAGGEGVLVAGRQALSATEPRLRAECAGAKCPRNDQSFFWARGECLEPAESANACGGAGPTLNLFGEWECWCAEDAAAAAAAAAAASNATGGCAAPIAGPQPEEEGRCVVPDLWRPLPEDAPLPVIAGSCSQEEHLCYAQGRVLLQGECVVPLSRGPCAEGQWVVLDRAAHAAVTGGGLVAKCAPRPCAGEHQLWLDFEHVRAGDQCQSLEDVAKHLCLESEEPHVDAFGYAHCIKKGSASPFSLPTIRENGICQPTIITATPEPSTTTSPIEEQQACSDPPCAVEPVGVPTQPSTPEQISSVASTTPAQVVIVTAVSFPTEENNSTGSNPESISQTLHNKQLCDNPFCAEVPAVSPTTPSIYQLPPKLEVPSSNVAAENAEVSVSSPQAASPVENVQTDFQLCASPPCNVPSSVPSTAFPNQDLSTNPTVPINLNQELLPGLLSPSGNEKQLTAEQPCGQAPCPASTVVVPPETTIPDQIAIPAAPISVPQTASQSSLSEQSISNLEQLNVQQQSLEQQPCLTLPCSTSPVVGLTPPSQSQQPLNLAFSNLPIPSEAHVESIPQTIYNGEQGQVNILGAIEYTGNSNIAASLPIVQANSSPQPSNIIGASAQPEQYEVPLQPVNSITPVAVQLENANTRVIYPHNIPGNVPPLSLQGGVPASSKLVNVPVDSVQPGQGDAVVEYVLLGQSNLPVNSV